MVRIYVSDVIDAPIEQVWGIIRDFNGMPSYHPFIRDSEIEGGLPSDAVGCVRSFHLANGGHLREQLLSLSDREHSCIYKILVSPMPVTDYVAGYRLLPITEDDRTFVEWWAEFGVPPEHEARIVDQVRNGTFRQAFRSIKEKLAAPGGA
ncbi:MAG: SRPBCC family protein [Acetobacteraceae bacterium]|nr:SRPBCC family protein [Acetobacteraceae bacterium]